MKIKVITLDNKASGDVTLSAGVFGLPERQDILSRMVNYQLAKRRAGTSRVKNRHEVSGTTKKSIRQKGSGGARHGAKTAPIFVGGGRAHGPKPRSYAHSLPKKVRALALRTALSVKASAGKLVILDDAKLKSGKTADFRGQLSKLELTNALFVTGETVDSNLAVASRNVPNIDVLPSQGANVYDILRRDTLVLTKEAVEKLEARLK